MKVLADIKRIHMIGIGGIGMSALARLFLHEGKTVSGSDRVASAITEALEKEGVTFFGEQKAENISQDVDTIVYTEAMAQDHPEMVAARELGVPMMSYFEALAVVANEYYLIAVAGTHGKTTTTAMLIDIFEDAGLDPTAVVGSLRSKTGTNYRAGKSKYFIVEADEYKENFKNFEPDILLINNLDHDHVDFYPTLADVQQAFHKLAKKVPSDGAVVAQTADKHVVPVLKDLEARIIDYKTNVDLQLNLKQPGLHNRLNAAAAKTVAEFVGIEDKIIDESLSNFAGAWRRFEYKGEVNGAPVYDDYAHNPQKVLAVIAGAREKHPDKKINVVFQSHTYSRTHELFDDFAESLAKADRVLMLPIYAAREKNESGVSEEKLVEKINEFGTSAEYYETLEEAATAVKESVGEDDVVLIVGAGNVTDISKILLN